MAENGEDTKKYREFRRNGGAGGWLRAQAPGRTGVSAVAFAVGAG